MGLEEKSCRDEAEEDRGKKALRKQSSYAHAQQFKRAGRQTRILKTYLGRVARDIERKADVIDRELRWLLDLTCRLLTQGKHDKHKVYSIHKPEVECVNKGRIHKRYEFGCKAGTATTAKGNWAVASLAFHAMPTCHCRC